MPPGCSSSRGARLREPWDICKSRTPRRWPGERENVGKGDNFLNWNYGKFSFTVEGINIKLLEKDHAYVATTYRNEEEIPVIRISGEKIKTRIMVNDK